MPEPGSRERHRATVLGAFLEGWRRVLRAPAVAVSILGATAVLAIPPALLLQDTIEGHLGSSLEADRLLSGWHGEWVAEFSADAEGLGRTFTFEVLGFGGALAALSRFVDHQPIPTSVVGIVVAYVAMWVFLSGGILDRLARARAIRASSFFAVCGGYFIRFVRLGIVIGLAYWALFRWLHPFLFTTLYDRWTRDLTVEHRAFVIRATLYALFLSAMAFVSVVADFAKVRTVVEDRRSMIGALGAAFRFIRRRPWRILGLYSINILAAMAIGRLWLQTAPSAAAPTWLVLLAGQLYVLARLWAKLAFMASEVAFFQGDLAHARYTAAPEPLWPDSPAVEAVARLRDHSGARDASDLRA